MTGKPQSPHAWFEASSRMRRGPRATPRRREDEGPIAVGGSPSDPIAVKAKHDRSRDEEHAVPRRLVKLLSKQKRPEPSALGAAYPPGAFEPEDIVILVQAFDEACAFLGKGSVLGPARRTEIAHIIISHARCGLLDAHRLALKAIAKVG